MSANMLGAYGEWAAQSMADPPRLSFRQPGFSNVESWRSIARARFRECLAGPAPSLTPIPIVQHKLEFDGLAIEHLCRIARIYWMTSGVLTYQSLDGNRTTSGSPRR